MSAAEKCMAEWEARHDVAARGHRGSPEALQHYFDRSALTPPPPPRPAGAPPRHGQEQERQDRTRQASGPPAPLVPEQPRARSGSLLSRLLHRSA
jgi:hypothetical protein